MVKPHRYICALAWPTILLVTTAYLITIAVHITYIRDYLYHDHRNRNDVYDYGYDLNDARVRGDAYTNTTDTAMMHETTMAHFSSTPSSSDVGKVAALPSAKPSPAEVIDSCFVSHVFYNSSDCRFFYWMLALPLLVMAQYMSFTGLHDATHGAIIKPLDRVQAEYNQLQRCQSNKFNKEKGCSSKDARSSINPSDTKRRQIAPSSAPGGATVFTALETDVMDAAEERRAAADYVHVRKVLRPVNDAIGWLAGMLLMAPFEVFCVIHSAHHRYTNVPGKDPDLWATQSVDFSRRRPESCRQIDSRRGGMNSHHQARTRASASLSQFVGQCVQKVFDRLIEHHWVRLPLRLCVLIFKVTTINFHYYMYYGSVIATRPQGEIFRSLAVAIPMLSLYFLHLIEFSSNPSFFPTSIPSSTMTPKGVLGNENSSSGSESLSDRFQIPNATQPFLAVQCPTLATIITTRELITHFAPRFFQTATIYLFWTWVFPTAFTFFLLGFFFDYLPHRPCVARDQYKTTSLIVTHYQNEPDKSSSSAENHSNNGRTSYSTWLLTIPSIYQNYHVIHHLYPHYPFYWYSYVWGKVGDTLMTEKGVGTTTLFPLFLKTEE